MSVLQRPTVSARGNASGVTAGLLVVAASGAAVLTVGPRLLDQASFNGLAVVWTISTVFGFGIATPTEQLLNKRLNAARAESPLRAARTCMLLAGAALVVLVVALPSAPVATGFPLAVPGSCAAVFGWMACAITRGRLLGAGDLRAYAVSQALEGVTRLLLISLALVGVHPALLLTAAVGLPLIVAAAWGASWRVKRAPGAHQLPSGVGREQAGFILVALGYQFALSAAPLLLQWRGEATVTGAFVLATSYFRAPAILVGGIVIQAMSVLSSASSAGLTTSFRREARRMLSRVLVLSGAATALGAALAPVALPVLFGEPLGLPLFTFVALGLSTVIAVCAGACTSSLLAANRAGPAVVAWLLGSLALSLSADALPPQVGVMGWALLAGPVVTLVVAGLVLRAHVAPAVHRSPAVEPPWTRVVGSTADRRSDA
jgi:O-antigen/teichoic acid export membrane protein